PSPLTARSDNKTKAYGQANPALTISYSGFLNADGPNSIVEPTASTTATISSAVGSYAITLSGGSSSNYSIILQNGTLTVGKATLTAKADDKTRVYGQANPVNSISYSGFVNGENVSVITPPLITGPNANNLSSVGSYPITLSGGTAANYSFNYQSGTLTITKAMILATANNQTQSYGQSTPTFTITYTGFVNGETTAAITSLPVATSSGNSLSPVGTYPILVSGGLATNYDFSYAQGLLTITKALLTATAGNQNKIYGQPNPTLTISFSGFVNGDNASVVTTQPIATTAATTTSGAGNYSIIVSGGQSTNYDFAYVLGVLTINKATLIAAADNKSRAFGDPNPPFTISYNGFVNGESASVIDSSPTASTNATLSSPIGFYTIALSGGTDDNYDFSYVTGILTVFSGSAPTVKNFQIELNEDASYILTYQGFFNNFISSPGDMIKEIRIKSLPLNGTLRSGAVLLQVGDRVNASNGQLEDLRYFPNKDYFGPDNFRWTVFNGSFEAAPDAQVLVTIKAVNDAPVLSNIELTPLSYSPADPPKKVSQNVIINDIDDNTIFSAKVIIDQNLSKGDLLALDPTVSQKIKTTFNDGTGELLLTGKDTKANYERALNSIFFSTNVSVNVLEKSISFVVSDSLFASNIVSRKVQITETLPDLLLANSFTPNGDQQNDVWPYDPSINDPELEKLKNYSQVLIDVFDKNGNKVFACDSVDCKWDGKLGGKELPSGPYLYTIDLNNGKRKYQGVVTILR
ncbi:MAG: T9SS type B sorting domain-containing protein, partial [Cyclobacteriaceae bacterium]|nr:T9SS type B sorting domain-containing protein [Cyclobacteriaceae bacterium]